MERKGLFVAALALVALTGCASSQEWSTWYEHRTHFASGEHMSFSIRTPDTGPGRVTRTELTRARDEGWWGKPVTVAQADILDR